MTPRVDSTPSAGIASTTATCGRYSSPAGSVQGARAPTTRSCSRARCGVSSSGRTTSARSPRAITAGSVVRTVKAGKSSTAGRRASSAAAGSGSVPKRWQSGTWQSITGTPGRGHDARTLRRSSTIPAGAKATTAKRPVRAVATGVCAPAPGSTPGSGRGVANLVVLDQPIEAVEQQRWLVVLDDLGVDDDLLDVAARRDVEHDVEQDVLDHGPQAACAGLELERVLGGRLERVLGEDELDLIERQELLVLLDDRVLRLGQDLHQGFFGQRVDRDDDRQAADELRDQAVLEEVVGDDVLQELGLLALALLFSSDDRRPEAERFLGADAVADDLVQALERAAADEQDVRGVDLDEVLVRVLAPALWRRVGDRALYAP